MRIFYILFLCGLLVSCRPRPVSDERTELVLWKNQAGLEEEAETAALIGQFNQSQGKWRVRAQSLAQGGYDQSVVAASLAGRLPCIMAVDSPMVASYAWAGFLRPLDGSVPRQALAPVSPAAIGAYAGKTYAVGQFDAALAIFARRSTLIRVHSRIPTLDQPWNSAEFQSLLERLKESGSYRYPLDLFTRDTKPSWWVYAYSPLLQSFGGDLIDRSKMTRAQGTLNGADAQRFGLWFQALFTRGLVNRSEPDDYAFVKGRTALSYTGNWWAPEYRAYVGDDLLILPPPDLGHGVVIGGGSWQWAITSSCAHPDGAGAFIAFMLQARSIAAMSDATGNVPVTEAGAAASRDFGPNGKSRIFFELMRRFARQRPAIPAFPAISNAFTLALRDIMDGKNIEDALDDGADDIDRTIADHHNYDQGSKP